MRVADLIEDNVDHMARPVTLEPGKPISQARGEVSDAADLWRGDDRGDTGLAAHAHLGWRHSDPVVGGFP